VRLKLTFTSAFVSVYVVNDHLLLRPCSATKKTDVDFKTSLARLSFRILGAKFAHLRSRFGSHTRPLAGIRLRPPNQS